MEHLKIFVLLFRVSLIFLMKSSIYFVKVAIGRKETLYCKCWMNSDLASNGRSVQFSSVTQSCPTLCVPMDCSMPGLPDHHQHHLQHLEFTQTHVHWVDDAIQPSHPLSSLLLLPLIFPRIRVFSNESTLLIRWPKYWVSASASVLPMNTQDWSPLGWTGWISLQSKGLSRVFSNTTVQKHQVFGTQLSL